MALYSAASKQKSLEKVEKELNLFQSTVAKDARLAEFIANPIMKQDLKKEALKSVAKKQSMSDLTSNLLRESKTNIVGCAISLSIFAYIRAAC